MAQHRLTEEVLKRTIEVWQAHKCNATHAARSMNIPRGTFVARLTAARAAGILVEQDTPQPTTPNDQQMLDTLTHRVKTLETALEGYQKNELTDRYVRSKIFGLTEESPTPPVWILDPKSNKSCPGVPTLLCSDWHWGEVIDPAQVGGVNKFNLLIAHDRAKRLIERTIDLLNSHMVSPQYPGIVMCLGGDMVSGDIHDELKETNDIPLIPAVVDLFGVLIWCIETLADKFGRVFLPCVTGNHGRNTLKMRAKDRHYTSFDWLLYVMLEKHFANDKRVTFMIPSGSDAYYRVYNHRYLLTHGDQFRGGDGMIGALGPIIRGDHKKRSRNNQIDMSYDTLLLGHWHQLIQMNRLIVNGSLCGYNEYAYAGNFPFEPPKQGLWLTHPQHGITFSIPVHVEETKSVVDTSWVSVRG